MRKQRFTRSIPLLWAVLALGAVAVDPAVAAGDAAEGAKKAIYCAYCHGADGNPLIGEAPRLAGQGAKSLAVKMRYLVPREDPYHPMMRAFITGDLQNDQDIENLAAYFASQPVRQRAPAPPTASR